MSVSKCLFAFYIRFKLGCHLVSNTFLTNIGSKPKPVKDGFKTKLKHFTYLKKTFLAILIGHFSAWNQSGFCQPDLCSFCHYPKLRLNYEPEFMLTLKKAQAGKLTNPKLVARGWAQCKKSSEKLRLT